MIVKYLLGCDVGTTGTKTLLFTEDGKLLGHAYRAYPLLTPAVGMSEQYAEDWWKAVCETVREVVSNISDPENVAAISLSLQGGTVVPCDGNGNALRTSIVWNDDRAAKQHAEFESEVGDPSGVYQHCGWSLGRSLPMLETRWIRDNEPEIFAKTEQVLTVPSYVSMKMTGIAAADIADAGIDHFYDIRKEAYVPEYLAFAGVTEEMMPSVVRSGSVIGNLLPEAAAEMGLTKKTVLVAGAHDQYAVAVGGGANSAGDVMIGSGTAWVVTGISDRPAFETGIAQSRAVVPGMWGSIFSLSTGGVCLEWLRKQMSPGADASPLGYDVINAGVAGKNPAKDGLFFYPFHGIAGTGKRFSKASFAGLDLSHDRFDMAAAVMEGVVFGTAWMMESFPSAEGQGKIRLAGGATKSAVWSQMIADITGKTVLIPEIADLACVGAAVIAGWGAGVYGSIEEGCRALAIRTTEMQPDPDRSAAYKAQYAAYKAMAGKLHEGYELAAGCI